LGHTDFDEKFSRVCGNYYWEFLNCLRETSLDHINCKLHRKALENCEIRNLENGEIFTKLRIDPTKYLEKVANFDCTKRSFDRAKL
jgi:hypothetical protein